MNVLVVGDTIRTPELRHEVPLGIPDSFVYAELDGRRIVPISDGGGTFRWPVRPGGLSER